MKKYNLFFTLFFIVSCTVNQGDDAPSACIETQSGARFDVEEIQVSYEKSADPQGAILPSDFLLKFSTCITDSTRRQPMRYHHFAIHTFKDRVESSSTEKNKLCEDVEWGCVPVSTDAKGCLTWTERYSFPLPAEQQWIEFERVIIHQTGKKTVPMMINPWKDTGARVVDLLHNNRRNYLEEDTPIFNLAKTITAKTGIEQCVSRGNLDQAFSHLNKSKEKESKAFLWVNSIRFNPSFKTQPQNPRYKEIYNICSDHKKNNEDCDKEGGFLNLNLEIPIKYRYRTQSGDIAAKPVKGGRFKVTPFLLANIPNGSTEEKKGDHIMLHRAIEPIEVSIHSTDDPALLHQAIVHIPYETKTGNLTLLIKVEPISDRSIEPFYGVYDIQGISISQIHDQNKTLSLRNVQTQDTAITDIRSYSRDRNTYKQVFQKYAQKESYAQYRAIEGKLGFYTSTGLGLELRRIRFCPC